MRVYLVDDHGLFRAGVRSELEAHHDVVGEAGSVADAVAGIAATTPDVVLLDVHMPDGGGVEVCRQVLPHHPDVRMLALSVSDAADDVIAVIRAGARGYVTKSIEVAELSDAITRVAQGDAVFSPRLAGFVLDAFAGGTPAPEPVEGPDESVAEDLDRLTKRESEVMRLIARGYTYRETAAELFVGIKTIETHVSAVLRKLQLSNRHELARWASDHRII